MPRAIDQLLSRGYWNVADDDAGSTGGGGEPGGDDNTDGQDDNTDQDDKSTDDDKTDDDDKTGDDDDSGKDKDDDKDPDKDDKGDQDEITYDWDAITLPDDVVVDDEIKDEFLALLKEDGVTQERLQQYVDIQAKSLQKGSEMMQSAIAEAQAELSVERQGKWRESLDSSDNFAGDKFEEAMSQAKAGYEPFKDIPELTSLMNPFDAEKNPDGLGLGDHPAINEMFRRIGEFTANDNFQGFNRSGGKKTLADKMYGDME